MNRIRQALAGTAALGVLIVGCTGAAHLKVLQPPAVPASHPIALPRQTATQTPMKLGIDVNAYTYRGQNIPAAARAVAGYVKSLHANSLAITFPFFMNGPAAPGVHATTATPTPHQIAQIARAAEADGLYVSIRPLLDETSIGGKFRGDLHLLYPHQWFASYTRFLLRYAVMAQRMHIPGIVVGTELTSLRKSPLWGPLDATLRRHYHGTLSFDSNWWGFPKLAGAGGPGVQEGVDAYPPITTRHLTAGWKAYDRILPRGTTEAEVGIAAAAGAFSRPWIHQWPGHPVDEAVQARWFTAACHAAAKTQLGGIYFWSIGLSTQFSGPTTTYPLAWAHSAGSRAISACFAALDRAAGK